MGVLARAAKALPTSITLGGAGAFDQGSVLARLAGIGGLGAPSAAGMAVTLDKAMKVSAYHAAVRVVAEDVSSVPLILYRRTEKGKERASDHATYGVLHDSPNPEMTSVVFRETLEAHVLSWGDCYAELVRPAGGGPVVEMWPLDPSRTEPRRDPSTGRLFYRVTLPSGEERDLRRDQVFHLPGLGFDGVKGYPVLSFMAREVLGVAIAQQEYVARFYAQGAAPGLFLKSPNRLSDTSIKHLREDFDDRHAGLTRAHRTAILEEGLDIGTIGISPKEQEMLDGMKWTAVQLGRSSASRRGRSACGTGPPGRTSRTATSTHWQSAPGRSSCAGSSSSTSTSSASAGTCSPSTSSTASSAATPRAAPGTTPRCAPRPRSRRTRSATARTSTAAAAPRTSSSPP
ncbi:MAG: phage portal protein [Chloroflexota bacterium]